MSAVARTCALLACCAALACGTTDIGDASSAIVGGTPDAAYDAVGVVYGNGGADVCTAVLVEPRIALTAAHCLDTFTPEAMWFGADYATPDQTIGISESYQHPNYGSEFDLAVLVMALEPAVSPLAWSQTGVEVVTGNTVTVVGYGLTALPNQTTTIRHAIDVTIGLTNADRFSSGAGPCMGDEGGPAIYLDPSPVVVATLANVDATCDVSVFERTDANAAFIQNYIPTPTPQPSPSPTPGGGGNDDAGASCACSAAPSSHPPWLLLLLSGFLALGVRELRSKRLDRAQASGRRTP